MPQRSMGMECSPNSMTASRAMVGKSISSEMGNPLPRGHTARQDLRLRTKTDSNWLSLPHLTDRHSVELSDSGQKSPSSSAIYISGARAASSPKYTTLRSTVTLDIPGNFRVGNNG